MTDWLGYQMTRSPHCWCALCYHSITATVSMPLLCCTASFSASALAPQQFRVSLNGVRVHVHVAYSSSCSLLVVKVCTEPACQVKQAHRIYHPHIVRSGPGDSLVLWMFAYFLGDSAYASAQCVRGCSCSRWALTDSCCFCCMVWPSLVAVMLPAVSFQ
jgi:hypothetical protein